MAKIAGRKNDGAWFRFNHWILGQPSATQAAFVTGLTQTDTLAPAYQVIEQYIQDTGVQSSAFPSSAQEWATELALGVPRQVWFGVTTYDYYQRGGSSSGGFTYTKLMQQPIFELSKDLRALAKVLRFAETEVQGLATKQMQPALMKVSRADKPAYIERRRAELKLYLEEHKEELAARPKIRLTTRSMKSKAPELRPGAQSEVNRRTSATKTVSRGRA